MVKQTPSIIYWLGDNVYLNITNQCTNKCYFCFRNYKDGINGFNLKLTEEPTANKIVTEIQEAGVDKVSVSLNGHDKQTYDHICKPKFENAFQEVLNFIKRAKEEKLEIEITAVTIPEVDIAKVREIAANMGVKFRVRPYIPCFW